jgi:isoaspartyl peptidase/L-asparaginase-like protein (Ntn-hydrolase superfamily)
LKIGAVAGVCNIANPIHLARKVMEETDHVLLVGEGANLFAEEIGIKCVDPSTLITETAAEEWTQYRKYKTAVNALFNKQ